MSDQYYPHLGGDARVVAARHPQRHLAPHPVVPRDGVLHTGEIILFSTENIT